VVPEQDPIEERREREAFTALGSGLH